MIQIRRYAVTMNNSATDLTRTPRMNYINTDKHRTEYEAFGFCVSLVYNLF